MKLSCSTGDSHIEFRKLSTVFGVCLLRAKKTLQLLVAIALFDPVIVYLDNVE